MKRIFNCAISNQIELLYAKRTLKNFLKFYSAIDAHFLEFATMELGTNLIKYTDTGELWFLLINDKLAIASVDCGRGIEDISIAVQKGYSSYGKESLGLGLYSLSSHKAYSFEIISFCEKNSISIKGSVFVLYEKSANQKAFCSISLPFYGSLYNGDFMLKKDNFVFFGDVSGHGKKAYLSVQEIAKHFYSTAISSIMVDNYFQKLNRLITKKYLRSFVGCLVELNKSSWKIHGVGNISILTKRDNCCTIHAFSNGIVGERFESVSSFEFFKESMAMLMLMTDGIDEQRAIEVVEKFGNITKESLAIAIIHFAGLHDDKTIAIFT